MNFFHNNWSVVLLIISFEIYWFFSKFSLCVPPMRWEGVGGAEALITVLEITLNGRSPTKYNSNSIRACTMIQNELPVWRRLWIIKFFNFLNWFPAPWPITEVWLICFNNIDSKKYRLKQNELSNLLNFLNYFDIIIMKRSVSLQLKPRFINLLTTDVITAVGVA